MTIKKFRELYKNTKDINDLINSHVEVEDMLAHFEYDDHYLSHKFSKASISVEDENNITIYASDPVEFEANTDYDTIRIFATINIIAKTNIYDILTGKLVNAELISSNISLDSTSDQICWEDVRSCVADLSAIFEEDWKNDLIDLLGEILIYDIFKGTWKHDDRKVIYDFILKYLETKYNVTEENDASKDMMLEAFKSDECQALFDDFSEMDIYYWIDELYYSYKDHVDQDEFDECACSIVSNYYDGFSFGEIVDCIDLSSYYDYNETEDCVYIKFSFK